MLTIRRSYLAMNRRPLLSALSPDQLMARAMEYRRMALTASKEETQEALIRLALRLVKMATWRKENERRSANDP